MIMIIAKKNQYEFVQPETEITGMIFLATLAAETVFDLFPKLLNTG